MEKPRESKNRIQINRAVFDGLEFIRQSGVTNMFDRPVVLRLAREWNFKETADFVENVDTRTYARLILQGPDVIEGDTENREGADEPTPDVDESDSTGHHLEPQSTSHVIDMESERWRQLILDLGKRAVLTIADTYEIEQMGVILDPSRRVHINAERAAIIWKLAEVAKLEQLLEETIREINGSITLLEYLIEPENN